MMLQLALLLAYSTCAQASATLIYQDLSSTSPNVYQGSAVGGVAVVSKHSVFTCGHTSEKTCGHIPAGCTSNKRIYATSPDTVCGRSDVLVTAHGVHGSLQWLKMLGGTDSDTCDAIDATSETVVVVGTTGARGMPNTGQSIGGADAFILGLDASDGKQVWGRHFGTAQVDRGSSVKISGRDVYALGFSKPETDRFGITRNVGQCSLAKMNLADGALRYSVEFGSDADDKCMDMAIGSDTIYVSGSVYERYESWAGVKVAKIAGEKGKGGSDILVVALSAKTGAVRWARILGGSLNDGALAIALSPNEDIYVSGYSSSSRHDVSGTRHSQVLEQHGYLTKLDKHGSTIWERKYTQVDSFSNIVFAGTKLFISGSTSKPLSSMHSKVSAETDTVIFQFDSSGNRIHNTVGTHVGISWEGLMTFESTDLAVVSGRAGVEEVFVSGMGMGQSDQSGQDTSGLLFKLSPNSDTTSYGDFTSTSSASDFGEQDEIAFVPGSTEVVTLRTADSRSHTLPMIRVEAIETGKSRTITVQVQRRNQYSRQWCSDASVNAEAGITAVKMRNQGNLATEVTAPSNLLGVDIPATFIFTGWKAATKGDDEYASIETAEIIITLHNKFLGDPTQSIANQAIVTLELAGTCRTSTAHVGGCRITTERNSASSHTIALLVQGTIPGDDTEPQHRTNLSEKQLWFIMLGVFFTFVVLCLCMCGIYVVLPQRAIAEERRKEGDDIFERIHGKMTSSVTKSPISFLRTMQASPRQISTNKISRWRASPKATSTITSLSKGPGSWSPRNRSLSPLGRFSRSSCNKVSPCKANPAHFSFNQEDIDRCNNLGLDGGPAAYYGLKRQPDARRSRAKSGHKKLHESLQARGPPTFRNPTLQNGPPGIPFTLKLEV